MKKLKLIFTLLSFILLLNCNSKSQTSSVASHPDFKIGKKGFEKVLKKEFDFQKISIGTYLTKKNGEEERGLNLTFQLNSLDTISYEILGQYAFVIKKEVRNYLLHLDNFEYINITFEDKEINGDFTKSSAIKIRKYLK